MRAIIIPLFGLLAATPAAAQSDQNGQSPSLGQRLLNGLANGQGQNQNARPDDGQRRGYQQDRQYPSNDSRNSGQDRYNNNQGPSGNGRNSDLSDRQDSRESGSQRPYNNRSSSSQNNGRNDNNNSYDNGNGRASQPNDRENDRASGNRQNYDRNPSNQDNE